MIKKNESVVPAMNRRQFLRRSAMLGGILVTQTAPSILHAANRGSTLNVAIIGTGAQGQVLLTACKGIKGLNFKAICDIWEFNRRRGQGMLKAYGHTPTPYVDHEEMLSKEKDLDAVIVATPDFVHHTHSIACMKAGLNVYCEKLMSNSLENAKQMVKTSRETGKLLQIGHQRRSNPRYLHALNSLLGEAAICGQLTAVNGQWNRAVSKDFPYPKKYKIDQATLDKYGYDDMHQFRNWRWFKRLGGGPISDLGAHQIDIFNWFLGCTPSAVMAGGGVDYYDNHEWEDNIMAIYDYPTKNGIVRAFYQVQTTTSAGGGYFEYFMGTEGSLKMSESPRITRLYKEANSDWDKWVAKGYLQNVDPNKQAKPWEIPKPAPKKLDDGAVDVRESKPLDQYVIPVVLKKKIHQPHLENFFGAVVDNKKSKLNCPGEEALASAATVLAVNDAIAAERKLKLEKGRFTV